MALMGNFNFSFFSDKYENLYTLRVNVETSFVAKEEPAVEHPGGPACSFRAASCVEAGLGAAVHASRHSPPRDGTAHLCTRAVALQLMVVLAVFR